MATTVTRYRKYDAEFGFEFSWRRCATKRPASWEWNGIEHFVCFVFASAIPVSTSFFLYLFGKKIGFCCWYFNMNTHTHHVKRRLEQKCSNNITFFLSSLDFVFLLFFYRFFPIQINWIIKVGTADCICLLVISPFQLDSSSEGANSQLQYLCLYVCVCVLPCLKTRFNPNDNFSLLFPFLWLFMVDSRFFSLAFVFYFIFIFSTINSPMSSLGWLIECLIFT